LARCAAIKPNGQRCKVEAMPDAKWCWSHHPEYEDARRRRASKGGKRGGRGRPQAELAAIKARLSDLADAVLEGSVDKGVAAVASQVLNVYLRAVSVELKAREQLELIERLEALEEALEANKNAGGRRWGA
jgi:hypothetical protein